MRGFWDVLRRLNFLVMGIVEDISIKGIENIVNKVKEENFLSRGVS